MTASPTRAALRCAYIPERPSTTSPAAGEQVVVDFAGVVHHQPAVCQDRLRRFGVHAPQGSGCSTRTIVAFGAPTPAAPLRASFISDLGVTEQLVVKERFTRPSTGPAISDSALMKPWQTCTGNGHNHPVLECV